MIKKIYLVHHTHMDIGYTDLPGEVMRFQRGFLDQALSLCENDPEFRWTIESSRLLNDYILHRPQSSVKRLIAALQRGQMELMAFDCQPLMELCTRPEQQQICAWAAQQAQKWNFPVECAILDDIGGWPATLPDFCRPNGNSDISDKFPMRMHPRTLKACGITDYGLAHRSPALSKVCTLKACRRSLCQVAGAGSAGTDLTHGGFFCLAAVRGKGAPGVETASGRRIKR